MFSIDLNKVPNNKVIAIAMITFTSILAPFWFIFQFDKPLFYKHDLIVLILLCLACGLPVFIYNTLILYGFSTKRKEEEWPQIAIFSAMLSLAPWYVPCTFTLIDHHFTLDLATKFAFFTEPFVITFIIVICILEKRRENKKKLLNQKETINTQIVLVDPLPHLQTDFQSDI